jgi:hypothetical protein
MNTDVAPRAGRDGFVHGAVRCLPWHHHDSVTRLLYACKTGISAVVFEICKSELNCPGILQLRNSVDLGFLFKPGR